MSLQYNTVDKLLSAEVLMEHCCREPWDTYQSPIKMAPRVYYVSGNNWVASYLIDTGDGLILIDTGMHETAYLLLENIRKLGFDYRDIKKILLSHAHIDHIGAARTLKELTKADLYLGKRDLLFLHERRDLIYIGNYTCGLFEPDYIYDDEKPIIQGDITIRTISTPGHTPGCTSFFFDVRDDIHNKILHCGMHGGIGVTCTKKALNQMGLPLSLQTEFAEGLENLDKMDIDVCLPSHTNQVDILSLQDQVTDSFNPYDDPSVWHKLMKERLMRVKTMIEEEKDKY
ncbi:MAG: MBL fold metallo-hydrolase [Spirochaetia bacterium]|jgi:metallo-beta-lactamase class B|nr:MBL fold metallo-hydrolase [Spirochaetia bacterium]